MDSLINAAARALSIGDAFGALNRIALREDAPALALRGIAMAQLGDLERARTLLRRAARAFGPRETVARARCAVAEAEVALAARDLASSDDALDAAADVLAAHGDRANAAHARHLAVRRLVLIGRLDEAEGRLAVLEADALISASGSALEAVRALAAAGIAIRRLKARAAEAALAQAWLAARTAAIPTLAAEVEALSLALTEPAARLVAGGASRMIPLGEVERILASDDLVVDACRSVIRDKDVAIPLATRPVLFALASALAEAYPGDVSRERLVRIAFRAREADESHRARLRVEIGRLRAAIAGTAVIRATNQGFAMSPKRARAIVLLARPIEEPHAAVLALLADGEAWSSAALALALGASQRKVQRALEALAARGKAQPIGRGRARRWTTAPLPGFATALLLPASPPAL